MHAQGYKMVCMQGCTHKDNAAQTLYTKEQEEKIVFYKRIKRKAALKNKLLYKINKKEELYKRVIYAIHKNKKNNYPIQRIRRKNYTSSKYHFPHQLRKLSHFGTRYH